MKPREGLERLAPALPLSTALLCLAFGAGCEDPLALPQSIENPRILAGRAEVQGRSGEAWPEPGESVDVSWLVVAPAGEPTDLAWRFEACLAAPVNAGPSECVAAPFDTLSGQGAPTFAFSLPTQTGDAPQVALHGVVCRGGSPTGPESCDAGDTLPAALNLGIAGADLQNSLPTLEGVLVSLGDASWPAPPSDEPVDCAADQAVPHVKAKSKTRIRFEVGSVPRDELGKERAGFDQIGDRETLELDYYSDAGKLSTPAGFVEADDTSTDPLLEVSFEAPRVTEASGRWVRFYFVSRDRRGGNDWLRRALCVVP
ncbi:MAG: hypothetical protein AB7K71_02570 [Polyangiaceae bacterium]